MSNYFNPLRGVFSLALHQGRAYNASRYENKTLLATELDSVRHFRGYDRGLRFELWIRHEFGSDADSSSPR